MKTESSEKIAKWLRENYGNVSNTGFNYIVRVMELLIDNDNYNLLDAYTIAASENGKLRNNAEKVIATYRKKTKYEKVTNKEFIHLLLFDYLEYKKIYQD